LRGFFVLSNPQFIGSSLCPQSTFRNWVNLPISMDDVKER